MVTIILIFIGFIYSLVFKLIWDYTAKNYYNRVINHARGALGDIILYTVLGISAYPRDWWIILGVVITLLSLRWIFFDPIFNYLNDNAWDYCGENSTMDRAADHLDGDPDNQRCNYYLIIKAVFLAAGILIWILG